MEVDPYIPEGPSILFAKTGQSPGEARPASCSWLLQNPVGSAPWLSSNVEPAECDFRNPSCLSNGMMVDGEWICHRHLALQLLAKATGAAPSASAHSH